MSPDDLATLTQTSIYTQTLAPESHRIMGKSMLLLSGGLVVVGNQVVMVNCSDSEPLSCSSQVGPTQEAFKSGWDRCVCPEDNMVSEALAHVACTYKCINGTAAASVHGLV